MVEVLTDGGRQIHAETHYQRTNFLNRSANRLTFSVDAFDYTPIDALTGSYFTLGDETHARTGMPIQPQTALTVPAKILNATARGVLLNNATYTTQATFDPLIAQAWAFLEASKQRLA